MINQGCCHGTVRFIKAAASMAQLAFPAPMSSTPAPLMSPSEVVDFQVACIQGLSRAPGLHL